MAENEYDLKEADIAWCPGCGNFPILNSLKSALAELDIPPKDLVMVSGIGQAAKIPHYLRCNIFNGLHGRALPPATAIKVSNPALTVIAESGDGDMYGEGGNHFIHTIRRNPNITNIVHNNMIYGLTKGQASPTSARGMRTTVQVEGVIMEPFNPLAVAIALDAGFVARAYAGDIERTKQILIAAIKHEGYSLVDILQPCVSFNKLNTYKWFREHTYYIEDESIPYDAFNRQTAFVKAIDEERLALGVFYKNPTKTPFGKNLPVYKENDIPIIRRETDMKILADHIDSKRV